MLSDHASIEVFVNACYIYLNEIDMNKEIRTEINDYSMKKKQRMVHREQYLLTKHAYAKQQ